MHLAQNLCIRPDPRFIPDRGPGGQFASTQSAHVYPYGLQKNRKTAEISFVSGLAEIIRDFDFLFTRESKLCNQTAQSIPLRSVQWVKTALAQKKSRRSEAAGYRRNMKRACHTL